MPGARASPWLLLAGSALAALVTLRYLWPYVAPFLLALVLAAVLDPAVDRLERTLGLGRGPCVLLVVGAAVLVAAAAAALALTNVAADLDLLGQGLPAYARSLADTLEAAAAWLRRLWARLPHPLDETLDPLAEGLSRAGRQGAQVLLGAAGALPGFLLVLGVAGLTAYFLSRDKRELASFFLACLPPLWRQQARRFQRQVLAGLVGYLRAQLILVALNTGLCVLGLLLLGVPYPWLLGVLAGLLDLVPVAGPGAVLAPLALAAAVAGQGGRAVGLLVLWGGVLLARQLVEPRVLSRGLGLHPVTTLAGLYLGVRLAGAAGLFLGPLALLVLKAVFVVAVQPRLSR